MAFQEDKLDEILALIGEIKTGMKDPPRVWLSPEEAATYLRVSRTRIYQYITADRIPFHRLPDSNLVRLDIRELDEWVKSSGEGLNTITDEAIRRLLK